MTRLLILTLDAAEADRDDNPADVLFFVPDPTVGGAWTELRGGHEVIRFGYRPDGEFPWLRIFEVPEQGHNVATQAIERIVFARGVERVEVRSAELMPIARRGTASHPAVVVEFLPGGDTP